MLFFRFSHHAFLNTSASLFISMSLSLMAVGGFGEVGRNCSAIKVDDEIFLFDLGLHLDRYVALQDDELIPKKFSKKLLIREGAVPDINLIKNKKQVKAIMVSHAHLDHVGAVPYLAGDFDCAVHATPFTIAVAKKLVEDKRLVCKNDFIAHEYNKITKLTDKVSVEFIEVTHSTPQTAAIALHTPYGVVLYVNDFKLDEHPVIGNKTDVKRLQALKPKVLIIDSLYADVPIHVPSESEAKKQLEKILLNPAFKGKRILVSTFSSHIARLHELANIADKLNRKVLFVGRSMSKYLEAAEEVGVSDLITQKEVVKYSSKARKALAKAYDASKYLFVVTGGMGEPNAVLSRIVNEEYLPLQKGDIIVFSNTIIPTPAIIEARRKLELDLENKGFVLYRDVHVSGHGAGLDHQVLLDALKPEFIVPVHGEEKQRSALRKRALASGMDDEHIIVLHDGEEFTFE
jgi:ribonuclease J